ncbi:reverse transcriptase [Plakobranchus ocellatus]|uniref:Reverse transcriptase n=1 Tax=Plakobranchus ocellatus TaxID=259542 RepID=A0AAV4CFK8_9GAST|nr:reverse transcriptase [Plakobranchus ocellatus]
MAESFCGIMSEEITPVLKSIKETLIKLETRISVLETDKESESRPVQPNATEGGFATDSTWTRFRSTDDTVGPSDTVRSRAPLASVPPGSISPTEQFGAADIQRDFERIRDSLVRIPVPTGLKVSDSSVGIKQECRPTLKILSNCARYGETGLKILSQIADEPGETINVKKSDLDSIFVTLAAEVNFLQSEFAALVVKSTFNEDTSRIFRSFENNQGSFSETSLQNVRVAAELAAAQSRFSQSHSQSRGSVQGDAIVAVVIFLSGPAPFVATDKTTTLTEVITVGAFLLRIAVPMRPNALGIPWRVLWVQVYHNIYHTGEA